jgi:hypothetical protein
LIVSQVSQIWLISYRNPPNLPFSSGSCSITEVIEQLYYAGVPGVKIHRLVRCFCPRQDPGDLLPAYISAAAVVLEQDHVVFCAGRNKISVVQ